MTYFDPAEFQAAIEASYTDEAWFIKSPHLCAK